MKLVVGYDGSPAANAAIGAGALLFPGAHSFITHVWVPPFASDRIRRRLRAQARNLEEFMELVEQEGQREAQRIAATGVTLARAAGWNAEPLVKQTFGAEGVAITRAADDVHADAVLVGTRGLGGTQALLGSVSDMVVHYCGRPVAVIPHPMLGSEYDALSDGPVVIGWDGSSGAAAAAAAAARFFPRRDMVLVSVDDGAASPPAAPAQIQDRIMGHLNIQPTLAFRSRGIADALIGAASDSNAAAVVVGSRGQSPVREILLGSVAMGTLHRSHRPIVVVPSEWAVAAPA